MLPRLHRVIRRIGVRNEIGQCTVNPAAIPADFRSVSPPVKAGETIDTQMSEFVNTLHAPEAQIFFFAVVTKIARCLQDDALDVLRNCVFVLSEGNKHLDGAL